MKIAIVTPLKDELEFLPRLFEAMQAQTLPVDSWVIVDNASSDGSSEQLLQLAGGYDRGHITVQPFELPEDSYELGAKYAAVVQKGLEVLRSAPRYQEFDAIGISDADCFPRADYFEKLADFMRRNPRLGLTSGIDVGLDGSPSPQSLSWVRGNCRIWRRECLDETGYIVGPSADTLSLCKARLAGWDAFPNPAATFQARPVGARADASYYGRSAYYRGIGPVYALVKCAIDLVRGSYKMSFAYLCGYFRAWAAGEQRVADAEIRSYYRWYLIRKLKEVPGELKLRAQLRRLQSAPPEELP